MLNQRALTYLNKVIRRGPLRRAAAYQLPVHHVMATILSIWKRLPPNTLGQRDHRRLLCHTVLQQGFTHLPSE
ncbi:hypothetical protein [Vreelandella andesensis]|uniref:hypothetical protein n=1 Tax=Vreelandella andesensis TaxID=447567 RepID=UPI001ABF4F79|nr:hypothetical protein [Halomonas andesensis]